MSLLGGGTNHIGIDIGTEAVRMVQLSGSPGSFKLETFGSVSIPKEHLMSDSKIDIQAVANKVKDMLAKSSTETKNVVSAIPGTSVYTALIKLPPMNNSELQKAITYQAENNLPVKIDEVKYDWQIIGQDPNTQEQIVMIIAALKTKIEKILSLFEFAGLNIIALETSSIALSRSLADKETAAVMILNIGASSTEVAIVENGILKQTRSFPLAGIAITRAVSKNLSLDEIQAENFKKKFGLSQDKLEGQVFKAIEPVVKNILDEAVRSAKFFEEQFHNKVGRIIITGGSSRMPLLYEYIKSYTETEVLFGNPWKNISFSPNYRDKLNAIAPEFATAVGLAMRL